MPEKTVRRRVRGGELPGTQTVTPQGYRWAVEVPDGVLDQVALILRASHIPRRKERKPRLVAQTDGIKMQPTRPK